MINKYFNKRQLDLLSEAEEYFRQVRSGFKRNSPHTLDVMVYETLNEVEPTQEPKWSCSKCIYTLYKRASEIYFNSKEKIENEKKEPQNNKPKNNKPTTSGTTTPKRRGRKPDGIKRSKP